jgi:hypothetical protein
LHWIHLSTWPRYHRQGPLGGFSGQPTNWHTLSVQVGKLSLNLYLQWHQMRHHEVLILILF